MTKAIIGFVLGTPTLAVLVALIVVDLTRPSDAELRHEVATDLGVPTATGGTDAHTSKGAAPGSPIAVAAIAQTGHRHLRPVALPTSGR